MLVDVYGKPFQTPRAREMQTPQSARVTRFARPWHESALRGLKPRDAARLLSDADAGDLPAQARLFADMLDRDAAIADALDQRALVVAGLDWSIDPPPRPSAAERRAAAGVAELLEGGIDALEDAIVSLMDAVGYGYSASEIVWRREGGLWLPDIYARPHAWLTSSEDGRDLQMVTDGGSEPLRALSWIIHQPKPARAGYLSRGGAFRALVWPFIYKAYAVGDFAEFLETFGLPFVVGKYGREASEDDKARLLAAVAALAHDARAIMPQEMQLEIQRVASSGNDSPHLAMVRWADEAIARTLKGQTLSGQAQSTGLGSGVANLHAQVRQDLRDADARQIAATLSRDLLWPMAMLNYGLTDPRRRPRLRFDVSATEDITAYAQAIPQLASAGVPIPVDWVRDRLGIPAPAAGAAVVAMGAPPVAATQKVAVATPDVAPGCGCAACAAGDYAGPEDDPTPVSLMTAQLDVEAANTGGAILDRVMRLVDEADSLTSLRDALLGAYGDRDTRQLSDIMALAFAAAHLAGRYDVENDHG